MQATSPSSAAAPQPPAATAPGAAVAPPPTLAAALALPGVIGAELSQPVSAMQTVIQEFRRTRAITRAQMSDLEDAVKWAQRIAMHSQQISRLAGGRLRQSHERLSLTKLLTDVLNSRARLFAEAGVALRHQLRQVDVIVDPGLLSSLIEVAVDWAAEQGKRIKVSLDIKNWPEHGMLAIKVGQDGEPGSDARPNPDTLNWHLLQQYASVMGVMIDRVVAADHILLSIEFARTVKQLEGLTAVEVDAGGESSSFFGGDSKPLAGHRVLLVTADARVQAVLEHTCDTMGLVLDTTPSTAQAVRFCELDRPHLIVIDEKLRDKGFDELRAELMRSDVNFPFIEVANASNTLEMANWMGNSMSRISRDALQGQLPSVLVMELAKVM